MKTRKIFLLLAVVALTLSVGACKKSRYCHCISDSYVVVSIDGESHNVADTVVVNIDRGMKCEYLREMGVEELKNGEVVTSLRNFDCVELDMDTVTTIPQEHPVED